MTVEQHLSDANKNLMMECSNLRDQRDEAREVARLLAAESELPIERLVYYERHFTWLKVNATPTCDCGGDRVGQWHVASCAKNHHPGYER